jgi:hypothetical protein
MLLAATLLAPALARAQTGGDYNIMKPEPGHPEELPTPWLPPTYKSPRGTPQHIVVPRSQEAPRLAPVTPPPLVSPSTGQVLPNLPNPTPSGPAGTETYQDRAARCAHQAGVYGAAAGDRTGYINSCINQ